MLPGKTTLTWMLSPRKLRGQAAAIPTNAILAADTWARCALPEPPLPGEEQDATVVVFHHRVNNGAGGVKGLRPVPRPEPSPSPPGSTPRRVCGDV